MPCCHRPFVAMLDAGRGLEGKPRLSVRVSHILNCISIKFGTERAH